MRPVRHLHLGAAFVMSAVLTFAQSGIGPVTSAVPQARHHIAHPPTLIAPQYKLKEIVNGFAPLENPSGIITNFGFLNDFPPQPIEATKTCIGCSRRLGLDFPR